MELDHLSASQIKTWLQCPQKYKLQYIDRIPWEVYPSAMLLGSAIHTALECFYREWQEGRLIQLGDLHEVFVEDWRQETDGRVLDIQDHDEIIHQGCELLTVFYDSIHPGNVVAVEDEFRIPLVDPDTGLILPVDLVGRFDLLEADDQGRISIVDHKVLSKRPADTDMVNNIQLWAYAYAARLRGDIPADENALLRIDALVKTKTVDFDQRFSIRTPESDSQFFQVAAGILHAIQAEVYPPNPGWQCQTCPVNRACVLNDVSNHEHLKCFVSYCSRSS